jgi:hypothetical protein
LGVALLGEVADAGLFDAQLDALEVRGYLDPGRRGDRADECDAIEMFLGDSLVKSR